MLKVKVRLRIPYPYNPGEYQLSRQVTGPRGGKSWEIIHSQPATGGKFVLWLEPGKYKETWWSNGWPSSKELEVA